MGSIAYGIDGLLCRAHKLGDLGILQLGMIAHQPGDGVGTILAPRQRRIARAFATTLGFP